MQRIKYYSISKKGKSSRQNEDFVALPSKKVAKSVLAEKGLFFVLSDGLGGATAGEIASRVCARTIYEDYYASNYEKNIPLWLINSINAANNRIIGLIEDFPQYKGMGTTLVSLLIRDNEAYINNVGDSRCYLYQKGKLEQISEDQSPAWENYRKGLITKDELVNCKYKHLISEAIGIHVNPMINAYQFPLQNDFTFLLCSDGLTDLCTDAEVEEIIAAASSLKSCCNALYKAAIKKGSLDDISLIIVSNYLNK
ncbi:MAG: protein phosphatase 2C domain-containing protein [Candidatus Cloacimonadales bacterium]